jgi:two-component system, NarL family, nitrate/nitrite response regulator NarL
MLQEEAQAPLVSSGPNSLQVLLIQVCPIVRTALRALLERHPGLVVTGEAPTCQAAIPIAAQLPPDVILLDATLPAESQLDQLPALRAAAPEARVLVLLGRDDPQLQQQLVRLGVVGVIWKDQPITVLFKALEKVAAGEAWLERGLLATLLRELAPGLPALTPDPEGAKIARLTAREREVIALVGTGLKNKAIAECLGLRESTVRGYLASIFDKLGVSDRVALVIYAYRHGLAQLPA